MSDPFLVDESSIEDSQPREFYEIVQNELVTYRIASGDRDVTYDGNVYTATSSARTDVGVSTITGELSVTLAIPLSHLLCQRYFSQGSPPRQILVTVYRLQLNSGIAERIWWGYVTSFAIEGHVGKFLIPSMMSRSLDRAVPSVTCGVLCQHVLYDRRCTVDPAGFSVATTVASVNGRDLKLATQTEFGDENFALTGDLLHVASGERQTVIQEDGPAFDGTTHFVMQAPIPEIVTGDTVLVRAGCLHDIGTCFAKFANQVNFGNQPQLPAVGLFIPANKIGIFGS